jgi:hypothetical protein
MESWHPRFRAVRSDAARIPKGRVALLATIALLGLACISSYLDRTRFRELTPDLALDSLRRDADDSPAARLAATRMYMLSVDAIDALKADASREDARGARARDFLARLRNALKDG